MQKKLFLFFSIFFLLVFIVLFRLYFPSASTRNDDGSKSSPGSEMIVDTWQFYSTEDFSILLPGIPQHISEKMPFAESKDLILYNMYLIQQPVGSTFMVSVIKYPDSYDTSDSRKILESITNEMLSNNSENHLLSSKIDEFQGKPSIDNCIANPSLYVVMKAVLSNKTLVVFTVVDTLQDRAKEHFEKAMKEFRLLS